ncbi:MAG: glycosyl hydrolase, partial [Planctomycetes bacterium]|nr:glycosyl hydrolase [Planctomycetota bacterium]
MTSNQTRTSNTSSSRPEQSPILTLLFAWLILCAACQAQAGAGATTPEAQAKAFQQRQEMHENGLFQDVAFRCVGPVVMSGRVVDIQPAPKDPYAFYVAYATGGLWKTENNGMRFTPLFEGENAVALGAIAVDTRNPDVLWVGTGEANSARSHYAGTGIYKSTDAGETWQCMGLTDSHHIGRILIDPKNSNRVLVAAMGHLYSENTQRGVFLTKDGGKTWSKVLYLNPTTGAIDITFDPTHPNVLYAAMWEKTRTAWNIEESGPSSGIYKSRDGGETWTLLDGFPSDEHTGRIGLAVAPNNPSVVYALLDNQAPKPDADQYGDDKISARKLPAMTKEEVLALTNKELDTFVRRSGFHSDYTGELIREQLDANDMTVQDLVDYMVRLNPLATAPRIKGAEVYRSDDAGDTWQKMNLTDLDSMYNIAGYYFGQIRVAPDNADLIYIMGLPLLKSEDGGRTYESLGAANVHVDHHAMWIDPAHPDHIINGNDGGLNLTYDGGQTWQKLNFVSVGQFYAVNVDMAEPYNIYGGLQDNGTFKGSSRSVANESAPWERVSGGDGFYIQIADDFTTYAGSQFGHYARIDTNGRRARVRPGTPKMDEPGLLFNWQTPILLSSHSDNVLYYGANRLFRSLDRGENLKSISPVLTQPDTSGNVPYGTLTTIAESRQTFGVLYTGTDDGRIHMTPDGGFTWKEIGNYLPSDLWCSRIETSYHTDGVVYLSLNNYRNDDFSVYLYKSTDFGQTWVSIAGNLPQESVNVIREDPINPHVLYVGTDVGVFVSLDDGASWEVLQNNIPLSPAHDLVVHPRDRDLVVGTHGRSIYVMDVEPIQKLTPKIQAKAVHLFNLPWTRDLNRWERKVSAVVSTFEPDPMTLQYWCGQEGNVTITISTKDGRLVHKQHGESRRGINTVTWDLIVDRDAELAWQMDDAKKKLKEAEDKRAKAEEETEKKDDKAEENDSKTTKLVKAVEDAQNTVKSIQRVMDEAEQYANQP